MDSTDKKGNTERKESKIASIEKTEKSKSKSKLPPFSNNMKKPKQPRKGSHDPDHSCHLFCYISWDNLGLTMLKMVLPEQVTGGVQPVVGKEQKEETPIAAGSVEWTLPSRFSIGCSGRCVCFTGKRKTNTNLIKREEGHQLKYSL